ncbi:hypothetical protein DPM33_34705 [Mesorhizobium hawassense]|uniref:Propionyl-coenzyme A carboxylase alpha polypeptide n=1 Tax=Mesorhizobium hawassense TaxID=1209954 RepID=A0A330H1H2_9HYPH|nr:hypothetical protein DPM33_34705 [Mesorhizobium hawassense]
MGVGAPRRPPLSCRTSPPQGGRLAAAFAGTLFCNVENWRNPSCGPIFPQVGEMSGRTEGGAKERGVRPKPKR